MYIDRKRGREPCEISTLFLRILLTFPLFFGIIIGRHHGNALNREVAAEILRVFPRSMSGGAGLPMWKSGGFLQSGGWVIFL